MYSNAEKKLYVKAFKINCHNCSINFGPDFKISNEPFNLKVTFETLADSPVLAKVDPHMIEKAAHLRLEFDPVLLNLRQDIYTQILRCLDLNINFQDFMEREYYFVKFYDIEEFFKQLKNVINMRIKIFFKSLQIRLKHLDGSFLSELWLYNMRLNMLKHMDGMNKLYVKIHKLYIFQQE